MNKNFKCADEMFAELGYVKKYESSYLIRYINEDNVDIFIGASNGVSAYLKGSEISIPNQVIKAIAKKIEEKEW